MPHDSCAKNAAPDSGWPRFPSFISMLKHHAKPGKIALIHDRNGLMRMLSYEKLIEMVERERERLGKSGFNSIGIFMSHDAECIIKLFAAAANKMRIAILDANSTDEDLKAQIQACGVETLFACDRELSENFTSHLAKESGHRADAGKISNGKGSGDDSILFFTSGTSSASKAVMLTEKSLCSSAFNGSSMLSLEEDDTLLSILPLSHVFGFVCSLLWGLQCGCKVALSRGGARMPMDLRHFNPSAVCLVPSMLSFFMGNGLLNDGLETVLLGAAPASRSLIAQASDNGLSVRFGYGLTETSSGVAMSAGDGDPLAMDICPDDSIRIAADGEILIHAPSCMMRGYLDDAQATSAVLKDGWLHSGDTGSLDESGKLLVTGRKNDTLVLSNGMKVRAPEYETALSKASKISDIAVTLKNGRLALIVGECAESEASAKKILSDAMADMDRHLQASEIIFSGKKLERTATGKIKRWKLREALGGD